MSFTTDAQELIATNAALRADGFEVDPVHRLAEVWLLTTGGEDLPLRFAEDMTVMLQGTSEARIQAAILEAANRASVTRERRWSYVLTTLNYYLIAMESHPSFTPAEQIAEREEMVADLRTKIATPEPERWSARLRRHLSKED